MPFHVRPDGCRLYFELHGPPDAPALLLLEGLGGDIPGWRRNIPRLAQRLRVVAYDFRGNGRSGQPQGTVSMSIFVDDTIGMLDELGLPTAHAYGQSFGGMVAIEMALTNRHRVRSLVLAATHAGQSRRVPVGARGKVPKDRPYLALYSEAFARDHPDHVAEDILVGSQNPQSLNAGRRQWQAIERWDAWDRLHRIDRPTLVLHGTEDRMVAVENAQMLAEEIPGAELVLLAGAGHVYHSEQPEAADRAVLAFIDRVEAAGEPSPS
jgi:pimeloyl-ACP methyl ester carboxylesterase